MTFLERPILLNGFCFFASNLNHTMGGFSFNIKKFARSNDASYDAQTLSNICVRKEGTVFPHIKAGLCEEKLSLMPCLRTFSNVLF